MKIKLENILQETFKKKFGKRASKYSMKFPNNFWNSHKKSSYKEDAFPEWTRYLSKNFFHFIAEDKPSEHDENTIIIKDIAGTRLIRKPCYVALDKQIAQKIVILGFLA
jgi:hypothetical protein